MSIDQTAARASASDRKRGGIFYGWWIVGAGALSQAYTSGTFWQGFGAFFDPIRDTFGWSRAVTSAAVSIQRTEAGLLAPLVGYSVDKFGPRRVMLGGILIMGLGFILLSRIQSLWQFYLAFVIITLGMDFGTFMVITTTIANWFVAGRARAMGITMAGTGLGGLLVPVVILLIAVAGWRTGLLVVGVGVWVIGIPVAMVMRRRPEEHGMLPDGRAPAEETGAPQAVAPPVQDPARAAAPQASDGLERGAAVSADTADYTVREALLTRTFWQMSIALGIGQLAMSASIHQIPAMSSFGVSREMAGVIILGSSLISMLGRLGSGFLGDWLDKRHIIAVSFASQFIGLIAFAYTGSILHLIVFMVFWGIGWGGSVPVRFALVADYFGRRSFGSIMGVMSTVSTLFGVGGPVLVGWMADARGNYQDPFAIMAFTVLVTIPMIWGLSSPRRRAARARRAA